MDTFTYDRETFEQDNLEDIYDYFEQQAINQQPNFNPKTEIDYLFENKDKFSDKFVYEVSLDS